MVTQEACLLYSGSQGEKKENLCQKKQNSDSTFIGLKWIWVALMVFFSNYAQASHYMLSMKFFLFYVFCLVPINQFVYMSNGHKVALSQEVIHKKWIRKR